MAAKTHKGGDGCAAPHCKNYRYKGATSTIQLFKFPADIERFVNLIDIV